MARETAEEVPVAENGSGARTMAVCKVVTLAPNFRIEVWPWTARLVRVDIRYGSESISIRGMAGCSLPAAHGQSEISHNPRSVRCK